MDVSLSLRRSAESRPNVSAAPWGRRVCPRRRPDRFEIGAVGYQGNITRYAPRHNPAVYFPALPSACATQDVPLGATSDISAKFEFVESNLCNDNHDCPVTTGDSWLSNFIPRLQATPEYKAGKTVIFITRDEDDTHAPGKRIPTVDISPWTHGVSSTRPFTTYSLLRTTEDLLGLPLLAGPQQANTMSTSFSLS